MRVRKSSKVRRCDRSGSLDDASLPDLTLKTSFDDIRRSGGRRMLHEHFQGAFPEAQPRSRWDQHQDTNDESDLNTTRRTSSSASSSTVGQYSTPPSASPMDTEVANAKRLSTVKESNPSIAIEQAIKLLQELKKTASPDDLVALHKALLPARDSVVEPASSSLAPNGRHSAGSKTPFLRRRSLMPPGIATRESSAEDVHKTVKAVKPSMKLSTRPAISDGEVSQSAVRTNPPAGLTAMDDIEHRNGYRSGTLRVTNGTASPDPSLRRDRAESYAGHERADTCGVPPAALRSSEPVYSLAHGQVGREASAAGVATGQQIPTRGQRDQAAENATQGTPSIELETGRGVTATSCGPRQALSRDYSNSWTRPQEETQVHTAPVLIPSTTTPILSAGQRQLSSLDAVEVQRSSWPVDSVELAPPPQHDINRNATLSSDQTPQPLDSVTSSQELPRFAQRWSHRISQIPYQAIMELQDHPDPHRHTAGAALQSSNDVSNEHESSGDMHAATTPAGALAKLTGEVKTSTFNDTYDLPPHNHHEGPIDSRSFAAHQHQSLPTPYSDSGYHSNVTSQCDQPRGLEKPLHAHEKTFRSKQVIATSEEDDASLYSFNAILQSPALLEGFLSAQPPHERSGKKRMSLLSMRRTKSSPTVEHFSPSPSAPIEFGGSSDAPLASTLLDRKPSRLQKKLKKRMPASAKRDQEDQTRSVSQKPSTESAAIPLVSEDMSAALAVHSKSSLDSSTSRDLTWHEPVELEASRPDRLDQAIDILVHNEPLLPKEVAIAKRPSSQECGRECSASMDVVRPRPNRSVTKQSSLRDSKRSRSAAPNLQRHKTISTPRPVLSGHMLAHPSAIHAAAATERSTAFAGAFDRPLEQRRVARGEAARAPPRKESFDRGSSSLPRPRSTGMKNMRAADASELARLKSRDIAIQNGTYLGKHDRPRTATPKRSSTSKHQRDTLPTAVTGPGSQSTMAHSFPWSRDLETPPRPSSPYAESIPSIPELPRGIGAKLLRMDGRISSRTRESAPPVTAPVMALRNESETPGFSTLSIAEAVKARKATARSVSSDHVLERPGYSTESVAEAFKRAAETRKAAEAKLSGHGVARQKSKSKKKNSRRSSRDSARLDWASLPTSDPRVNASTGRDTQLEGLDLDSSQIGEGFNPHPFGEQVKGVGATNAKAVLVNIQRRPSKPTPLSTTALGIASSNDQQLRPAPAFHERTDSAERRAGEYRDLIGENKDNVPDESMTKQHEGGSTSKPSSRDGHGHITCLSPNPYLAATQPIERARSPGGRVITPSGSFYPYTVADAEHAQRSRAASLAALTGTEPANRDSLSLHPTSRPSEGHKQTDTLDSLIERYNGGFQFGYERGAGFGGSAGMRSSYDKSTRKSVRLSQLHGVDLSDVPIFLQETK